MDYGLYGILVKNVLIRSVQLMEIKPQSRLETSGSSFSTFSTCSYLKINESA